MTHTRNMIMNMRKCKYPTSDHGLSGTPGSCSKFPHMHAFLKSMMSAVTKLAIALEIKIGQGVWHIGFVESPCPQGGQTPNPLNLKGKYIIQALWRLSYILEICLAGYSKFRRNAAQHIRKGANTLCKLDQKVHGLPRAKAQWLRNSFDTLSHSTYGHQLPRLFCINTEGAYKSSSSRLGCIVCQHNVKGLLAVQHAHERPKLRVLDLMHRLLQESSHSPPHVLRIHLPVSANTINTITTTIRSSGILWQCLQARYSPWSALAPSPCRVTESLRVPGRHK